MKVLVVISLAILMVRSNFMSKTVEMLEKQEMLKHKVGIVTGGSTGIGYATALLLARLGTHVVFCARDSHPDWYNGSSAEQSINNDKYVQKHGGSADFVKADVRVPDDLRKLVKFTVDKFGDFDFAVNNAGVGGWKGRVDSLKDEWIQSEHDPIMTNLYGVINSMRIETEHWMNNGNKNKTYSIVNTASRAGKQGCPDLTLYSASKHAVFGVTRSVAVEYAATQPRVRVNGVAPSWVDTYLVRNAFIKPIAWEGKAIEDDDPVWKYVKRQMEQGELTKRMSMPEDIAKPIVYLLSELSDYISGVVLSIDGGDTVSP